MKTILCLAGALAAGTRSVIGVPGGEAASQVSPRPQIERLTTDRVMLAEKDGEITIKYSGEGAQPPVLAEGRALLARRLEVLRASLRDVETDTQEADIIISKCSADAMRARLAARSAAGDLEPNRLAQAYELQAKAGTSGSVTVTASGDLGLYYGLMTLVQLIDRQPDGALGLPAGEILDWPEVALRLAKTSASENPPEVMRRFADWVPLYKFSQLGLQFHGEKSLAPDGNFTANVEAICGWARRTGVCETVVYFCPFRGKEGSEAYDFGSAEDRARYADLLRGFLAQGAHGVELDYNDWGLNPTPPIEDVINLTCKVVDETDPSAYIYYCAPDKGPTRYEGPASTETTRILSQVPPKVWPFWVWTRYTTLMTDPLEAAEAEAWTKAAGRRPFLWVNRAGWKVEHAFGKTVEGADGAFVFYGEGLPKDLNRLFEGVHINIGMGKGYNKLPKAFPAEALVYLATTSDFLWNPQDWDPVESGNRARRFVEIMAPLQRKAGE